MSRALRSAGDRATLEAMSANPQAKPQEQTPAEKVEREPLAEVIDEVRADAARDPQTYARETIVPEGGE